MKIKKEDKMYKAKHKAVNEVKVGDVVRIEELVMAPHEQLQINSFEANFLGKRKSKVKVMFISNTAMGYEYYLDVISSAGMTPYKKGKSIKMSGANFYLALR